MAIQDGKRYKILLTRTDEIPLNTTIGRVEVIDLQGKGSPTIYTCYSLENGGPSTDLSGKDKRIVARDYTLEWVESSRNGNLAKNYPEFKRGDKNLAILLACDGVMLKFRDRKILIHIGNSEKDTLGCILLGKGKNVSGGTITNSIVCVKEFYNLLEKIGIENCFLRILEI